MKNQQAVRLARDADPLGERTIGQCGICLTESNVEHALGVLTKPDTVLQGALGAREEWMSIIKGRKDPLKHGYYCVRLANDQERARIPHADFSTIATKFFEDTDPWKTVAGCNRFGVDHLVSELSLILVGLMQKG